jgi:2-oxoglutarate ferredoxin oxidoreductase subunit alpha
MVDDVLVGVGKHADSALFCVYPGNMPSPDDFEAPILKALKGK